jgi:hypothetical protein
METGLLGEATKRHGKSEPRGHGPRGAESKLRAALVRDLHRELVLAVGSAANTEKTRVLGSGRWVVVVAASYFISPTERPGDIESIQVVQYFASRGRSQCSRDP